MYQCHQDNDRDGVAVRTECISTSEKGTRVGSRHSNFPFAIPCVYIRSESGWRMRRLMNVSAAIKRESISTLAMYKVPTSLLRLPKHVY